ncbi:hypothetical protein PR048_003113, partial [Dryococelus australis]
MEQFDTRFQDFKKNTASFNLYSCPFSISINDVSEDLQIECVDLHTYLCEQVFSRMKHVKCTSRSRITDGHLESSLCVTTSLLMADIGKLIGGKQCQ